MADFALDDATFFDLVADGTPLALAHAIQYRTALALRLLRRSALERALAAADELGADTRRALEEEIAARWFLDARRLADPRARAFFERTFPAGDPVQRAIASLPEAASLAEHEEAYVDLLRGIAHSDSAASAPAARALAALSFGEKDIVAPVVTTFRALPRSPLARGAVLRVRLDLRVASDRADDVLFRRDPSVGRGFRRAAEHAQALAGRITGDGLFRRVALSEAPLVLPVDGPSAGLAIFAATALAATHRNPPPPWIGFTGAFDDDGRLAGTGQAFAKVTAAIAGGIRALFLPASAEPEVRGRVRAPIRLVFLPRAGPEELFECIEREIAALAPHFLRLKVDDARKVFARAERLFSEGKRDALAECTFLVRALEGRRETDALATLGAVARAKLGRTESRRGDAVAARRELDAAERALRALVEERRLEREGREVLAEIDVWRAINLIDYRDFEGALAAVDRSLAAKRADPYASNHSLARSHGTRAIVLYSWARTLAPGPERDRRFAEAEAALEENLRRVQPFEQGRVRGYLGTLRLYQGRAAEAAAIFREILRAERPREGPPLVDPRWAREGLAHALLDMGEHEEAIRIASAPIDVGIDEEIRGRLLRWKGAALRELGRRDEARDALRAAIEELGRWPAGHPKSALAVAAWIEMALLDLACDRSPAGAIDAARALCDAFEHEALRAHFAPARAALDAFGEEAARRALGRLLP